MESEVFLVQMDTHFLGLNELTYHSREIWKL